MILVLLTLHQWSAVISLLLLWFAKPLRVAANHLRRLLVLIDVDGHVCCHIIAVVVIGTIVPYCTSVTINAVAAAVVVTLLSSLSLCHHLRCHAIQLRNR